jgi:hypothetical protein
MGWRFRRIIARGPFHWTLNKRGVGWSVGVSGFRVGVSPYGHRHVSMGIPGTGLYWCKNLDAKRQSGTPSSQPSGPVGSASTWPQQPANPVEPWWKQKAIKD